MSSLTAFSSALPYPDHHQNHHVNVNHLNFSQIHLLIVIYSAFPLMPLHQPNQLQLFRVPHLQWPTEKWAKGENRKFAKEIQMTNKCEKVINLMSH